MKKVGLSILGIVILAGAGLGSYLFVSPHASFDERHTTCLAAVIPAVVLHHQQEEIVQLIQDLAKEAKENLAPEKSDPVRPIFSSRADGELLKIAEAFQASATTTHSTAVDGIMTRALQYLDADAPQYIAACMNLINEAKSTCGTLEAETDMQKNCLDPYSEKINQLVKTQVEFVTK